MNEELATPTPMLQGEMVHLTAVEPDDLVEDSTWISDAEIGHNLGIKGPLSRSVAERFAKEALGQVGKTLFPFNIRRNEDGRRVGGILLRDLDRENGSAEVALFLGNAAYLGRGMGTDALRCLLDYAFGEQRLERVQLHVFDFNARARRSYEKAGFTVEARLRRARFHRGTHHDVDVMSILRDEWLAQERRRAWDPVAP